MGATAYRHLLGTSGDLHDERNDACRRVVFTPALLCVGYHLPLFSLGTLHPATHRLLMVRDR
jgi:hypothetical protein